MTLAVNESAGTARHKVSLAMRALLDVMYDPHVRALNDEGYDLTGIDNAQIALRDLRRALREDES